MIKTVISLIWAAALSFSISAHAQSDIRINVGEAKTKKSLMAFPALQYFGTPSGNYQKVGADLYTVITSDLTVSSYFQFISQAAFLEDTAKTSLKPAPGDPKGFKFQSWSAIGADFLIKAGFTIVNGQINLETYLYHVPRASVVLAKVYKGPVSQARKMAHTYANDVLKALTGVEGPFLGKLVFTSDRAGGQSREVYISDWDGENLDQISRHRSVTISPAWSPDATKIAYTAYVKRIGAKFRNADMLLFDLRSGKRSLISYRPGINSGAAFAPDNKHIYLTISQGTSPDIYKMTFDGTLAARVTRGPAGALNVEPAVSPDGSRIAFSSDRSGRPMIYVMNADGSNPKRITFAGVFNSTPAWSPDGKKIAFAGQAEGNFDIFVMNADGSNMIRLTSARRPNGKMANNEDPSFSPDGRFVVYTSNRTGSNQIYMSTVEGTEERRISNDNHNYFKPKWSVNVD